MGERFEYEKEEKFIIKNSDGIRLEVDAGHESSIREIADLLLEKFPAKEGWTVRVRTTQKSEVTWEYKDKNQKWES